MNLCLTFLLTIFRVIAIPAQFQDCKFTASQEDIKSTLNQAAAYFNDQYGGTQTFEFDLAPVVTLPDNLEYYGKNSTDAHDVKLYEGVIEACRQAGESIDFTRYDNDGDGVVDVVILYTAGLSEADGTAEDNIWPQQDNLGNHGASLKIGDARIDTYLSIAELWSNAGRDARLAGIGNICHEFGHILGLPDYYDTDGKAAGHSRAMWGSLALMDEGNLNDAGRTPPYFNALDLELLGLGKPENMEAGSYTLEPIQKNQRYLKAVTEDSGEYFLFEVRDNTGRDAGIGGSGLVIYHIDRRASHIHFWEENKLNTKPEHQHAYAIPCVPDAETVSQVFYPQGSRNRFTPGSDPAFISWSEKESPFALTDIKKNTDGSVSFNVIRPFELVSASVHQDAIILSWIVSDQLKTKKVTVSWSSAGEPVGSAVATGNHFSIEGLEPHTTYEIRLTLEQEDLFATTSATTKAYHENSKSYIYLNGAERNTDGSFKLGTIIPLRVYNATDVNEVRWFADGARIYPDADGNYTITGSFTLKAEVIHTDGKHETLLKLIATK